jgi:hypothetical protein
MIRLGLPPFYCCTLSAKKKFNVSNYCYHTVGLLQNFVLSVDCVTSSLQVTVVPVLVLDLLGVLGWGVKIIDT